MVCTVRCCCDQRFMVFKNMSIVQIKVIVADVCSFITVSKCIVKCCIQMIVCTADSDNVPGMTVFDSFFRIVAAYRDHTPDSQRIEKDLDCFGNAFADANALSQRSNDLMGICLLELIIMYILTDKVMYIFLLFPLRKALCRAHQFLYSGFHCLLMLFYFSLIKQIFRDKNNVR